MSTWEIDTTTVQASSDTEQDYKRDRKQKCTCEHDQTDSDFDYDYARRRLTKKKKRHKRSCLRQQQPDSVFNLTEELSRLVVDENTNLIDLSSALIRVAHHDLLLRDEHHNIRPVATLKRLCLEQIAGANIPLPTTLPTYIKRQINQILLEKRFTDSSTLWFNQALKQGEQMAKLLDQEKRKGGVNWHFDRAKWRCYRSLLSYKHFCCHYAIYNDSESLLVRDCPEFESNCSIKLQQIRNLWPEHVMKILCLYFVHLYRYEMSFGASRHSHSANKRKRHPSKLNSEELEENIPSRVMKIIRNKVQHQFPYLMQLFETEVLGYAYWTIGNPCEATRHLFRVAQSENFASSRLSAPLMIDCALMWSQFDIPDMATAIYDRLKKVCDLYSPYKQFVRSVGLLAAHNYDVGFMSRESAYLSYTKWNEVIIKDIQTRQNIGALFYGMVFLFVAHGENSVKWLHETRVKLEFNVPGTPYNFYFLAYTLALLGEKSKAKEIFRLFASRWNILRDFSLSEESLMESFSTIVDRIVSNHNNLPDTQLSDVRVPHILWRREFAPPCFYQVEGLFQGARSNMIGQLCCKPLNMRLTDGRYLFIDIETQLPPRNYFLLDPFTGQLINDYLRFYSQTNIPELHHSTNRDTFSLQADFSNPRRIELHHTDNGDVIDLHIFGLLLSMSQGAERRFMFPDKHNLCTVHWCGRTVTEINLIHHMKKELKSLLTEARVLSNQTINSLYSQDRCMALHEVIRILRLKKEDVVEGSSQFNHWMKEFLYVFTFSLMKIVHLQNSCGLVFSYHPIVNKVTGDSQPVIIVVIIDFSCPLKFQRPKVSIFNDLRSADSMELLFSKYFPQDLPDLQNSLLFPIHHKPYSEETENKDVIMSFLSIDSDSSSISVNDPIGHWVIFGENVFVTCLDHNSNLFQHLTVADSMTKTLLRSSACGYIALSITGRILVTFEQSGNIRFYNISKLLNGQPSLDDCSLTISYKCLVPNADSDSTQITLSYSMLDFYKRMEPCILDCHWCSNEETAMATVAFEQTLIVIEMNVLSNCVLVRNVIDTPGLLLEAKFSKNYVSCIVGFPLYPLCNIFHSLVIYDHKSEKMLNFLPGLSRGPHDILIEELDDRTLVFLRDGHRGIVAAEVTTQSINDQIY